MDAAILEAELAEEKPKTDAEYAAIFDKYLSGIKIMQRQMEADQREFEAVKAEIQANIKDIMQTLKAK